MTASADKDVLLAAYGAACSGEMECLELHFKYKTFYATAAITFLGGPLLAWKYMGEAGVLALLFPVASILLSVFAISSAKRHYRRFLEHISIKIKLEALLGLDQLQAQGPLSVFPGDTALIPARHIESRASHASSSEWIQAKVNGGAQQWAVILFVGVIALAVFELVVLVRNLI